MKQTKTTLHLDSKLYKEFKKDKSITLIALVTRAMSLYLTDVEFKLLIYGCNKTKK